MAGQRVRHRVYGYTSGSEAGDLDGREPDGRVLGPAEPDWRPGGRLDASDSYADDSRRWKVRAVVQQQRVCTRSARNFRNDATELRTWTRLCHGGCVAGEEHVYPRRHQPAAAG